MSTKDILDCNIPREDAVNAQLTFLNGSDELEKRGREYLESRLEDIYTIVERNAWDRIDEIILGADHVEWEDGDEYDRIQFSWGGPSDELRIRGNKIEYVFLDWFVGVGFDVSNIDYVREFVDYFKELGVFEETTEV